MNGISFGNLITSIGNFFQSFLLQIQGAKFTTTTQSVITILFILAAVARMGHATLRWIQKDSSSSLPEATIEFGREVGKIYLIWGLVAAAPFLVGAVSSAATSNVKNLVPTVASAAQGVLDTMGNQVQAIWNMQSTVASNLAENNPWLFQGYQDQLIAGSGRTEDTQLVQAAMQRNAQVARTEFQSQLSQAQKLIASPDPKVQAQGQALKQQAQQGLKNLENGLSTATTNAGNAKADQQDALNARNFKSDGWANVAFGLRMLTAGFTLGISEFFLWIKRCLAGLVAFVVLAPGLLLAVMGSWKVIQAAVGLFSHLVSYAAVLVLAASFGLTLGPLAMLCFATDSFKSYGFAFVSFWFQALAGSLVLAAAVKILVTGFGTLSAYCASIGSAVVAALGSAQGGITGTLMTSLVAGLGFLMAGLAMDFFGTLVQKAPTAGIGQISGSFQP